MPENQEVKCSLPTDADLSGQIASTKSGNPRYKGVRQ
jgi:hypothetical protein